MNPPGGGARPREAQGKGAPRTPEVARRRRALIWLLAASTAINVGFLVFDPRMMELDPWSAVALFAGGAAYVVALPLVLRDRVTGYRLCVVVAVLASAVVLADNVSAFGSTPNAATFWLNLLFFAIQVPLVIHSVEWLRRRTDGSPVGARSEPSNTPIRE
jgi:hypothetical protein